MYLVTLVTNIPEEDITLKVEATFSSESDDDILSFCTMQTCW
jgi:hypothetical protein